ncbi:hypothetical protein Tco_1352570 [Tanacetum coccineum]
MALRSDRGWRNIIHEFKDYLKACGIVQIAYSSLYTTKHILESLQQALSLGLPTKKVDRIHMNLWFDPLKRSDSIRRSKGHIELQNAYGILDMFLVYGGIPEHELRVDSIAMLDLRLIEMLLNLRQDMSSF